MNNQRHIHRLFKKYLNNSCTPAEARELIQLLQSGEHRAYFEYLMERHLRDNEEVDMETHGSIIRVFNKLDLGTRTSARKSRRLYWKIAAAAVAVITCAVGLFSYVLQPQEMNIEANEMVNDAAPGGNRATLTLSDGRAIFLDEADEGAIAEENGFSIRKTADGQLQYELIAQNSKKEAMNTISTPQGGQYQIILPDGTTVWLNASSSLTYPTAFHGQERRVTLTGEGYFEVRSHQGSKPFIVESANQRVEVLGTHFNVNAYPNEISVNTTLLEGSVKIVAGQETVFIMPGEQSQVGEGGILIAGVDVESAVDWKNGDFIFVDEDLTSIMRKVARWYDVEVVYEKNMTIETYTGRISRQKNLSEVLRILELSGGLHFKIENKTLYLSQ